MAELSTYIVNQVLRNREDLFWCIGVAFTGAARARHELCALEDDVSVETIALTTYGHEIVTSLTDEWDEKQARLALEREDRKYDRMSRKLANRALYLPRIDLQASTRSDHTVKWRFDEGLDSAGLMARMLEHMGVPLTEPVVMNVLNRLPRILNERGEETSQQYDIPREEAELFWDEGYLFSAGKTLWNFNIEALKEIFLRTLPLAIDFSSYNRRFRAPLVPGGFLPRIRVRTHNLSVGRHHQGADGSGVYDPTHKKMVALVERYGAVAIQFTAIQPESGKMWKGVLVPREGINDKLPEEQQSAIHFDHLQVKGFHKGEHKVLAQLTGTRDIMDDGVYIGVMKAKTQFGRVSSCFETLENLGPDPKVYTSPSKFIMDKKRIETLVTELTTEGINKIGKMGPEGLLARATRDDQYLRRLGEFLTMANEAGANINPLDVPLLTSKVDESLGRALWTPAQGASMNGKYPMVIIDNTLQKGECVISCYKPGKEIACWRFPTILAQGLRVLTVVGPRRHHKIDGKPIPNIIWMNPFDIVTCQQGDDDGDEVGVSSDPRIVELFKMRKDNRIFHIEPAGEKLDYRTDSPEGREYIGGDPMGPVGAMTIMKAMMAAVGDKDFELAFSVGIQEAIDAQKNLVRPTDPHRASNIDNWYKDENGEFHIHYHNGDKYLTNNFMSEDAGEFPLGTYKEACENALIAAGCIKMRKDEAGNLVAKAGWPLGWRTQKKEIVTEDGRRLQVKLRKTIAVDNWLEFVQKQDFEGGNWVHHAHDVARDAWLGWREKFQSVDSIPNRDVLPRVLANLGVALKPLDMDWTDYKDKLREAAGLNYFGQAMKRIRSSETMDEQKRIALIDQARAELDFKLAGLSAEQLLTIWIKELTPTKWFLDWNKQRVYVAEDQVPEGVKAWRANTPNYAFAAVTNRHSAILELLGLEHSKACQWLVQEDATRAERLVRWCVAKDNPYHRITMVIRQNTAHAEHMSDKNGAAIALGECTECQEHLKTLLIRSIRATKTAQEKLVAMSLVSTMNAKPHVPYREAPQEQSSPSAPSGSEPMWM